MKPLPSIPIAILSCALPALGAAGGDRIEDNSFLIEEAYNQEPGVIQHISTFQRSVPTGKWQYTLTEEWPAWSQDHQLSVTLPLGRFGEGPAAATGIGDVQLHYRYALHREEKAPAVAVVRLSLLLPTGDAARGLGAGGMGIQLNLPVSVNLGERFVTHWNVGGTWVPSARSAGSERGRIVGYAVGQSLIWLARPAFNLMVEALWTETEATGGGETARAGTLTVSPGFRAAVDFESGLQVVWGLGLPLGLGPSRGEQGFLAYVSFEHPLRVGQGRDASKRESSRPSEEATARAP
jgi:hypothetical protein